MVDWLTAPNIVGVISIALQLTAAYYAYRLMRITGAFRAWALVVIALFLMAFRRITAFMAVAGLGTQTIQTFDLLITPLAISLLLLYGMYELSKKFEKILKK